MATQFPVSYSAQAAMYSNRTASQSAGTYYIQGGPSDSAEVIEGNLRVTGNLQVDGNEVVGGSLAAASIQTAGTLQAGGTTVAGLTSTGNVNLTGTASLVVAGSATASSGVILQPDRITPSAAATLSLSGGLGAGGAAGGSVYTFYKGCGPLGSGVIGQDHLQLFRFGPAGVVQPALSQVLDIAPKAVANASPAENVATMFADLAVSGALTAGLGSFSATPPAAVTGGTQFTMTFGGWRLVWGKNAGADTGEIFFKNAAGVNTPFSGQPMMIATAEQFSTHGYFDGTVAADRIINLHGTTQGGTGYGTYVWWLCIGPA